MIHFTVVRGENEIDTRLLRHVQIAPQFAGIGVIVGLVIELKPVDEYAHHLKVRVLAGDRDQADVPVMQVAHRGYKSDGFTLEARFPDRASDAGNRFFRNHFNPPV